MLIDFFFKKTHFRRICLFFSQTIGGERKESVPGVLKSQKIHEALNKNTYYCITSAAMLNAAAVQRQVYNDHSNTRTYPIAKAGWSYYNRKKIKSPFK